MRSKGQKQARARKSTTGLREAGSSSSSMHEEQGSRSRPQQTSSLPPLLGAVAHRRKGKPHEGRQTLLLLLLLHLKRTCITRAARGRPECPCLCDDHIRLLPPDNVGRGQARTCQAHHLSFPSPVTRRRLPRRSSRGQRAWKRRMNRFERANTPKHANAISAISSGRSASTCTPLQRLCTPALHLVPSRIKHVSHILRSALAVRAGHVERNLLLSPSPPLYRAASTS